MNEHTQKKKYHQDHVVLPKYVGCYKDQDDAHDLKVLIGTNLKIKTCFDRAKSYGYAYAGLQNGNQCWAGDTYGKHGRENEYKCNYMCYKRGLPENQTCGGKNINSIWDISKYNSGGKYEFQPGHCKRADRSRAVQDNDMFDKG